MVPQGLNGPRFLVTQKLMAIMDYYLSHSYALAVGHLADRIRGQGPFKASWPETDFDSHSSNGWNSRSASTPWVRGRAAMTAASAPAPMRR